MKSTGITYVLITLFFILCVNANGQTIGNIAKAKKVIQEGSPTEKTEAYNQLGWEYRKMYPDSSIYFLKTSIELIELYKNDQLLPETYNYLGVAYLYKGDYLKSYDYHEKAKDLALEKQDSLQYAHALNSLGRLFEGTAAYDKAIDYYYQALDIFEKLDNKIGLTYIYSSLATFYQSQKSYIKAEEMSKRALKIRIDEGLVVGVAFSYLELAKIYSAANKNDLAHQMLSNSRVYSDSVKNNLVLKAEVNTEIANLYRKDQQYEEAKRLMEASKDIAEGITNQNLLMKVYNQYGILNYDLGNYDEAIAFHIKVVQAAENSAFWKELKQSYLYLSKSYEAKGNAQRALEYFKNYNEIENKFLDIEKARLVQQHESRIALEKRAQENELLKIEKKKNNELLEEQRIRNFSLTGLLIVLVIFAFTVQANSNKKKRANEKLSNQKDKLADLNLQKDTLMNILAHDLKAPFNRIRGLVELIKVDKSNQDKYIHMIDQMSINGSDLIKNVLDVNKLEAGEANENVGQVDVEYLLKEKLIHYTEDAKHKNITLQNNISVDRNFITNQLYLERIVDNLISNAIKYSSFNSTVKITSVLDNQQLKLIVTDDGPGFTEDDKKSLYSKFKTLSAKPTGGEASNGLGLSLVKSLVDKLRGKITLLSEVGKGSTFEVIIPELTYGNN
ncbi:histidine kinase [Marivirga lumbricoides]|uniref:histidine kinase n=1 Tax=Marivirga lumbricoides TaxID=1046115 RepID=A0ABQ1N705_9BACT|nr:histidine kinase [Marivirga lumbricoides]